MSWHRPQVQPIGLDIGADSIKMLQLELIPPSDIGAQPALSVIAAARQSLPEEARKNPEKRPEIVAELIRRMLAQQPFVGRKIVAALPRDILHVKNLRLPSLPEPQLADAVHQEATALFPFETASASIRFLQAGEVRQGSQSRQELIVMAAKNCDVDRYLEQLHSAGVIVASLDTEITAMFRAFERFGRRQSDQQDVQMLIDIGALQTQVLIGRGREISFFKSIGIGGLHLLDAVGRKLGITSDEARALRQRLLEVRPLGEAIRPEPRADATSPAPADANGTASAKTEPDRSEVARPEPPRVDPVQRAVFDATRSVAEELAKELSMCLRYYSVAFRGHRPQRIRIIGGEAADPQLHAIFRSILLIPVEAGKPLFSVDTIHMRAADRQGAMAQWALATGLSLRQTSSYFAAKDGKPRAERIERRSVETVAGAETAAESAPSELTPAQPLINAVLPIEAPSEQTAATEKPAEEAPASQASLQMPELFAVEMTRELQPDPNPNETAETLPADHATAEHSSEKEAAVA